MARIFGFNQTKASADGDSFADYDSDLPNHAEYTVERRAEGKNLLARLLLVGGYVLFGLAYFAVAVVTRVVPVVAILPMFIYIFVLATWRYVTPFYSVRTGAGVLSVIEIISAKNKPQRLQITLKEATSFVPVRANTAAADKARGLVIYDYRGTVKSSTAYGLYFTDAKRRRAVLYIETTEKLVRSVNRYMPDKHN